jgi:hypothetical protein
MKNETEGVWACTDCGSNNLGQDINDSEVWGCNNCGGEEIGLYEGNDHEEG